MEDLETLTNLQELWLGRNRIKAINLYGLKCIKKLSLQSNRLTSMLGLQVLNFRKMFYSIYMTRAFTART
jgi:Leucine-rich repeat (LRR) protein